MCKVTLLDGKKRREIRVKRLSSKALGGAIMGFEPWGSYVLEAHRLHALAKTNFDAFWVEIGPLGRKGLIDLIGP